MAKPEIQSEKYKKDFMMMLAFLLFAAIVAAECFLAIWLPWHLKLDSVWATQVARQELIDRFDLVRGQSRLAAERLSKPADAEAILICRSLDRAASYMHKYGKKLSPAQCRIFMDVLLKLHTQYSTIAGNRAYSKNIELNKNKFLKKLRGHSTAKPTKP